MVPAGMFLTGLLVASVDAGCGFEDALHSVQAAVGRWACFGTGTMGTMTRALGLLDLDLACYSDLA